MPQGPLRRSFLERLPGLVLRRQVAKLGRHVALVILGEDLIGDKRTALHSYLGNGAAAFAKQIRDNAAIEDGRFGFAVGDDEADGYAIGGAPYRSLFDHAAEAYRLAVRCLARDDVGRRVKIGCAIPQAPHGKQHRDKHGGQSGADQHQTLVLWLHRRLSASAAASARRIDANAHSKSVAVSTTATMYAATTNGHGFIRVPSSAS